jgi:FkbM family methyltransferase
MTDVAIAHWMSTLKATVQTAYDNLIRKRGLATVSRVADLVRRGGVSELRRGIRDYILLDTPIPIARVVRTGTLRAGGVTVLLKATSSEALWRCGGHNEQPVQDDFVETVAPGDLVWDVGANIGSYSLLAAEAGGGVVAFEPGPRARGSLVANASLNNLKGRINATPYALADCDSEGMLLPAERTGVRELAPDGDSGDTVPVRRGDSVDLPAPDVIKIDVEGAEVAVLDGLAETLATVRVVYVEIHDGIDPSEVTDRLSAAGLSVSREWHDEEENLIVRSERDG